MSSKQVQKPPKKFYQTKTFKVSFQIALTLIIFVAEAITGYLTNCLALLSDSFHTLSDVISLSIGLVAIRTSNKQTKNQFSNKTFGYSRAEVLGGIIQAVFLYALCFNIYISAIKRFFQPEKLEQVELILVVGGIGLAVNLIGLFLFSDGGHSHGHSHGGHSHSHSHMPYSTPAGRKSRTHSLVADTGRNSRSNTDPLEMKNMLKVDATHSPRIDESYFSLADFAEKQEEEAVSNQNLNTRGIFLHILGDTLGSVAVMVSAGMLWYYENDTDNNPWLLYIDPALTFLIATIIAASTYPLLMSSMAILMENAPNDINIEEFQTKIQKKITAIGFKHCTVDLNNENLASYNQKMLIHDLHIWQLSSTTRAATIHVLISRCKAEDDTHLLEKYLKIVKFLKKEFESKNVVYLTIQPEFINMPANFIQEKCGGENGCNDCGINQVGNSSSSKNDKNSSNLENNKDCENLPTDSNNNNQKIASSNVKKQQSIDIEDLGKLPAVNQRGSKKLRYKNQNNDSRKSVTDGVEANYYP